MLFPEFHNGITATIFEQIISYPSWHATGLICDHMASRQLWCHSDIVVFVIELIHGAFGFINRDGELLFETSYKQVQSYSEGLARVWDGEYWGYINKEGEVAIEPQFDYAYDFSEGLALMRYGAKWGFINPSGELAIMPSFDRAWDFSGELARILVDGRLGYINQTGITIWPREQ